MPTDPTTTAVAMTLTTIQFLKRSWPRIVWYFAACPFCSRNPNTKPVRRPRNSCSVDSNMISPFPAEQQKGRRCGHSESDRHKDLALNRQLQVAADAVPAGASPRDPRPEDHDGSAQ